MQRWQLTTGLAAATVLAALVVPSLSSLLGAAGPAPRTAPTPTAPPLQVSTGPLSLEASLDQTALLQGMGDDRFLVIEVSAPEREGDVRRPVHLSVVMDVSGSMAGRGKIDNARAAAHEVVDLLRPEDSLSLVTFSDHSRLLIPAAPMSDPSAAHSLIRTISPGGGTNLHDGVATGLTQLDDPRLSGIKRVLLLSDGVANIGVTDTHSLSALAGSLVSRGVSLSALGLGLDYNEDLLAAMSDAGGGGYHFVDRPGTLAGLFADELHQMTAVVGREASVRVVLPDGVELIEVIGYQTALEADGYSVFLGDLHGGQTQKIVARLSVPDAVPGALHVADVSLRYSDADTGEGARAQTPVEALITPQREVALSSVRPEVRKSAVRAQAAGLLDAGARAYVNGDLATNQASLAEGERLLRELGAQLDDDDLQQEASQLRSQREAFDAAPPTSAAGLYQVKKSKEAARGSSRH